LVSSQTCHRQYPGGPVGNRRSPDSHSGGLPRKYGGSASTSCFSRPAQRSLTLRPACSRNRLKRFFPSKASTASLPPPPLRLLPAGATSCRAGLEPTENQHLSQRTWSRGVTRWFRLRFTSVSGFPRLWRNNRLPCSVFTPRSANRTGGFPASGSRTRMDVNRVFHAVAHGRLRVKLRSRTSPNSW
jgi:hypothetical protein